MIVDGVAAVTNILTEYNNSSKVFVFSPHCYRFILLDYAANDKHHATMLGLP